MNSNSRENIQAVMTRAIREFFGADEIYNKDAIENAAHDYVYNHDQEILAGLRDCIDWDSVFESILDDAIEEAYAEYEPW